MENPETWTEDTRAIQDVITKYFRGVQDGVIGGSLALQIETEIVVPLRTRITQMEAFINHALAALSHDQASKNSAK